MKPQIQNSRNNKVIEIDSSLARYLKESQSTSNEAHGSSRVRANPNAKLSKQAAGNSKSKM